MNFLAHLHIADHCDSDLQGNLLGDFVKGNPDGKFSDEVVAGIRLHRFVDKYTDNHSICRELKFDFEKAHQRFAPIALDLFWDHCLANDWNQYHSSSLELFCNHAEIETTQFNGVDNVPERYRRVIPMMWQGQWILSYQDIDNIGYALKRMSTRSPRMAPLEHCIDDIRSHYSKLRAAFNELYPDVLEQSKVHFERQLKGIS